MPAQAEAGTGGNCNAFAFRPTAFELRVSILHRPVLALTGQRRQHVGRLRDTFKASAAGLVQCKAWQLGKHSHRVRRADAAADGGRRVIWDAAADGGRRVIWDAAADGGRRVLSVAAADGRRRRGYGIIFAAAAASG